MIGRAYLGRKFYDKFGDDVVDELVTILNAVDATYRAELRKHNEANFRRFEAKLREEIVSVRSEGWGEDLAALGSELREEIAALGADIITWIFVFWVGTMATTVALVFAVVSLLR